MKTSNFKKKVIYIAEFSLPNMSAYAVHVIKMCDNFSKNGYEVELIVPHANKKYNYNILKKNYLLKKNFKVTSIFKTKLKLNLLYRILFSIRISLYIQKLKYKLILSRSVIPSIFLSITGKKNILELHTEVTGFTSLIFKYKKLRNNLRYVVLNSKLIKLLNLKKENTLILDDAVEVEDFKFNKNKINLTCAYSGSFAAGKGLNLILNLAEKLPYIKFHIYGNMNTLDTKLEKKKIPKNIIFKGYLNYNKLVKILPRYKVLLMPYQSNVGVLIKNINVSTYFSPLKMFEYMASGSTIIASNLKVYKKILIDNHNSIIIKSNDQKKWVKMIKKVFYSKSFSKLGVNAQNDVKKFTWNLRVKKIISFSEKNFKTIN